MAFTRFPDPTNNIANLANQPVEPPATLKQKFDQFGEDSKDWTNNVFLPELEAITNGDSGADNIGATPVGTGVSATVQGVMEELDAKIDTQLPTPDGSVTDAKLSNTAGQIKDVVSGHTTKIEKIAINPMDYTGTDNQKLQSAINDSVVKKTKCMITDAYTTVATLNIPSYCFIEFSNKGKITNNSDNSMFSHTSEASNENITILNANIEGNHSGNSQYAFNIDGVKNLKLLNSSIKYFARGIKIDNCENFIVEGNEITNCGFTLSVDDRISIFLNGTSEGKVFKNVITNGTGSGIKCLATENIEICFNKIWYCSVIGIIGDGGIKNRIIIIGNSCCYNGTVLTSSAEGGINFHGLTNGIISHNVCCFNLNYGIDVNGDRGIDPVSESQDLIVSENICTDNTNIGIIIFASKRVIVSNNVCARNYGNITVSGAECENIKIIGNNLTDDTRGLGSLYIQQCENVLIENNTFSDVENAVGLIQIRIESNVVGGIIVGYNDFTKSKKADSVFIGCTRDKIDFKDKKVFVSDEITLSGSLYSLPIPFSFPTTKVSCILKAYIIYTEASSVNAGVVVGLGELDNTFTYWASATTLASQPKGSIQALTLSRNGQVDPTKTKGSFYSAGIKTGLGKIKIVVEYVEHVPVYN